MILLGLLEFLGIEGLFMFLTYLGGRFLLWLTFLTLELQRRMDDDDEL